MVAMGEGVQANLRDKWANEAWDFTPWLAENLNVLGDAVGLKLEAVQQEQQVGSFSLDILAREVAEDVTVVIENQLEWTDHSHLGQLLTYAAGCNAQIAIWVADEFQHEHAEALNRLNEWAGTNIRFYGVKVDVTRDGDCLQPRLCAVVYPGGWNKELTLRQPPPPNPAIEKHRRFFDPLIAKASEVGFAEPPVQVYGYNDRRFRSGFDKDIGYAVSFAGGAWVFFHIRTWDSVALSNRLFDALEAERQQIESSIDAQGEWHWDRYSPYSMVDIGIRREGTIDDAPEQLEAARTWMLDLLPKFKMRSRIERQGCWRSCASRRLHRPQESSRCAEK